MIQNAKISKTLLFFILASVLCIVVRSMQLASAIDYETGFYYNSAGVLGNLLYIIFGIGIAALIIISAIDKKSNCFFFTKNTEEIGNIESSLTAFMLLLAGASLFLNFISGYRNDTDIFIKANNALRIIAPIGGFMGFAFAGLSVFIKKKITLVSGYLLLMPSAYYSVRAVVTFLDNLVITRMSEQLIILLIDIFLVFFYLSVGRIFSKNEGKLTRVRALVTGYAAAALIFSETVSKIFFWITSSDAMRDYLAAEGTMFKLPGANMFAEGIVVFIILYILQNKPSESKSDYDYDDEYSKP